MPWYGLPVTGTIFSLAVVILIAVQALKVVAILNAIRWINRHGSRYKQGIESLSGDPTPAEYWDVLDASHGGFFPFGVLEFRLQRYAHSLKTDADSRVKPVQGRLLGIAIRAFDLTAIAPMVVLVELFAFRQTRLDTGMPRFVYYLVLASGMLLAMQFLLIVAEAVFAYARLGSYARAFHRATEYRSRAAAPFLEEVYVLAGLVIFALCSDAFLFFFSSACLGAYSTVSSVGSGILVQMFSAFYSASLAFLMAGQPQIQNWVGQAVVLVATFHGAAVVVLMLSVLTNAVSVGGSSDNPP